MDGMILKVERAPEDSALGNPLDAKVQAPDDFITHLCVQCTIQASHLRSTMREELNESHSTFFFFTDTLLHIVHHLQPHLSFRDLRSCRGDVLSIHIVSGVKLWAALM